MAPPPFCYRSDEEDRARATSVVVARHPLDMAVSLFHQAANLDRIRELLGPLPNRPPRSRPPIAEWARAWIEWKGDPVTNLDSLPGVMWHLADAWSRRDEDNVVLVHCDDLSRDLEGQMGRLAAALGESVTRAELAGLSEAATFEAMRERCAVLVPDQAGVLRDRAAFFGRGRSGAGAEVASAADLARDAARVDELAPADVLEWLHR